jgi:hypothetical protein
MQDFSNVLSIALTKQSVGAGAIMTSAIALRPFSHVGKILELGIIQQISRSPAFIKWMTEGYSAKTARLIADNMARITAQGLPRSGDLFKSAYESAVENPLGVVPQGTE